MSDRLPDNIKRIDVLRIERGLMKSCRCLNPHYLLDNDNRIVYCKDCGAIVDPFEALCEIARGWKRIEDQVRSLLNQRKELIDWKPHLVALRKVEKTYRSGKYIPSCPHCRKGILAEELATGSTNKEMELQRRQFEKKEG
jgi:hypothetical protein